MSSTTRAKRLRGTNFSEAEEDELLRCIAKYLPIIENKKTDGPTIVEKQRAWESVTIDFNAKFANMVPRNNKAMKDKYTNLKSNLRKQLAAEPSIRPKWQPRSEPMANLAAYVRHSMPKLRAKVAGDTTDATAAAAAAADDEDDDGDDDDDNDDDEDDNVDDDDGTDEAGYEDYLHSNGAAIESIDPIGVPEPMVDDPVEYKPTMTMMMMMPQATTATVPLTAATVAPATTTTMLQQPPPPSHLQHRPSPPSDQSLPSWSSSGCVPDALVSLKRTLLERELAMREVEHSCRMAQQKAEHEKRMELLEAQRRETREKALLHEMQLKIATLTYRERLAKRERRSTPQEE